MHCRRLINHHGNIVLRRTLKSLEHIDYCWLKNRWRKLVLRIWTFADWETVEENGVLAVPQISSKPSSTADAEIFNGHSLLVAQKPLMKTVSLGPKNHQKTQFYGWQWQILRTWTFPDWESVDENGFLAIPKISSKPSSTADAEIFNGHRLLLTQKPLTKIVSMKTKNS
jgi:hypothetical protein